VEQLSIMTDLSTLKFRWGARKGNITKVHKHYKQVGSFPLKCQNPTDLQKRVDYLEAQMNEFEIIQDRIEDLSHEEGLECEEYRDVKQQ